ncbi:hypothetical protein CQA49_00900 [Helicobacter sp. MIT 00-7814]|uniref:hypothetical protein n=1 Tax=unclassified Helicobacter TaxID=2593540 RepID=UPI000E1F5400|nr:MULTISPECIES: hypothetical protein [unclassified Helicobacter]RDU55071.1 hypothetical protein CQA37_04490 [Helicobacter sp. MIT 99-10781]RDU56890.1 hypothetical protein CQA49_00900 [Helicobacter sp. MIT 00-7814]
MKLIYLLLLQTFLFAYQDLGVVGKTYNIEEADAMEEFQKNADKVNKKELQYKILAAIEKNLHADLNLGFCKKDLTKSRDVRAILKQSVVIPEGDIYIPEGTVDTSLDYGTYAYLTINLNSKEEFEYYRKNRPQQSLLIATGDVRDERIKKVVEKFILDTDLARQLGITCTPSIVTLRNGILEVKEVYLKREGSNAK